MELLAEDLLLLALDDDKGTVPVSVATALDFGLAGAMIADMAAQGRLHLEKGFWGEKLSVTDASSGDNRLFNDAVAAVAARPHKSVAWWVHYLSSAVDGLRARLLEQLVARGTLQRREQRVLLVFHRETWPERDGRVERDIRQRIDAVLEDGAHPSPHLLWLLQLAKACGIIDTMYPWRQRGTVKARIEALSKASTDVPAGVRAVNDVIAAQQQAVMVAIMAASVAATSSACSSAASSSC